MIKKHRPNRGGSETRSEIVEAEIRLDEGHAVGKPYPNPARQQAKLEVAVRESQPVRIELYDVLGRHIRTIHDQELSGQRTRRVRIETRALSSGLYFVRVKGSNFTKTRRLTVVR